MKSLLKILAVSCILNSGVWAQCNDIPMIHILSPSIDSKVVLGDDCPTKNEVLVAIKKDDPVERFQIDSWADGQLYYIKVKDKNNFITGNLYKTQYFNSNEVIYGGSFKIGSTAIFGGGEYQRSIRLRIDHTQEYRLYTIDLTRLTIEPVIHQYIQFQQYTYTKLNIFSIQPASLGINVKTSSGAKIGLTSGPEFISKSYDGVGDFRLAPSVNVRLSIPLDKPKKKNSQTLF